MAMLLVAWKSMLATGQIVLVGFASVASGPPPVGINVTAASGMQIVPLLFFQASLFYQIIIHTVGLLFLRTAPFGQTFQRVHLMLHSFLQTFQLPPERHNTASIIQTL
jgi:hypothetical protein